MTKKIFPLPVKKNKFGNNVHYLNSANYYRQVFEEVQEAFQAAIVGDVENILQDACMDRGERAIQIVRIENTVGDDNEVEELVDIIICCVTRLEILGYDEDARQKLYHKVNEKNRERGYFEE